MHWVISVGHLHATGRSKNTGAKTSIFNIRIEQIITYKCNIFTSELMHWYNWLIWFSEDSIMPHDWAFIKSISDVISRCCVYVSFYTNGADDLLNSDGESW